MGFLRIDQAGFFPRQLRCVLLTVASFSLAATVMANTASPTLDTAKGPVTVPDAAQRVIALDEGALDTALALGVQPVAAVSTRDSNSVSEYLEEKAGPIAIVGATREFNIEAILQARPDLILASKNTSDEAYALVSRLAPTIIPRSGSQDDWRGRVREYAQALGKEAEAEQALTALDERIEALAARIEPGQIASVVRWNPQGPILMSNKVFAGQLLQDLGFSMPPLAGKLGSKPHSDTLSLENLGQADADWLFVATLNPKGEETLAKASEQPAFERLDAVQNHRVVSVDGQVWSSGSGILAAHRLLDELEQALPLQ